MEKILTTTKTNFRSKSKTIITFLIYGCLCILGISGTNINSASANMGTDSAGVYRWGDDGEEFCSYEWNATSGATQINLTNGTLSDSIPIGFDFPYYYETYSSVKVFSGGFIVFEPLATYDSTEIGLIPQDSPSGIIAGLWDDLDPGSGGTISYSTMGTVGDRFFVISFEDVPSKNSGENVTFQIVLFEGSGDIAINIEDAGTPFMGAIGISDPHGVAGKQFYGPTSIVPSGSAICINFQANYMDPDGDMIPYFTDNCPLVDNINQEDMDGDNIGDACDVCPEDAENDMDGDSICGNIDNCPAIANATQEDTDEDGIGDACDPCPDSDDVDSDGDGVCDLVDNCPSVANDTQEDTDEDGIGDACDPCPDSDDVDTDGDGICDLVDNCPSVVNATQDDTDEDGIGDACDLCPLDAQNDIDEDGVCGDVDNCPDVANADQLDTDGDNIGDLCDDNNTSGDDDSGCSCKVYTQSRTSTPGLLFLMLVFVGLIIRKRLQ